VLRGAGTSPYPEDQTTEFRVLPTPVKTSRETVSFPDADMSEILVLEDRSSEAGNNWPKGRSLRRPEVFEWGLPGRAYGCPPRSTAWEHRGRNPGRDISCSTVTSLVTAGELRELCMGSKISERPGPCALSYFAILNTIISFSSNPVWSYLYFNQIKRHIKEDLFG